MATTDLAPAGPASGRVAAVARRVLRGIAVAALAAVVVGVPVGVAARLLMRLVALATGGLPQPITLGGTMGIIVVCVVFALPATLVMAARPRWARWVGAVFTVAFSVFPSSTIALQDLEHLSFISPGRQVATVAVALGFVALFAVHGQLLARLVVRLLRPGVRPVTPGRA